MKKHTFTFIFIVSQLTFFANADVLNKSIQNELPNLEKIYHHLHQTPELSKHEVNTATFLAKELKKYGYDVTEGIAGTGLVAILKNGTGPTIMLRADTDGLPVLEETGLPYASVATFNDTAGLSIPVMHACGHDMHMTVLLGTAKQMVQHKDQWQGTLMLIAQPGEEIGYGAKQMLAEGLYKKFPLPDYNIAMHVSADLPAGKIGYIKGYAMANVDSVDILIKGIGGHGAYPHNTIDPVVMASEIVIKLQTIVSREISPLESAVITVGSIHGGTKHNIIGNEVKLQLTVRSYSDESRNFLLKRIEQISHGIAKTAGIPDELLPKVIVKEEYTPAVYNQPEFTQQVVNNLEQVLGKDNIVVVPPVMAGEDFSRYGRTKEKIPSTLLWLGTVNPTQYKEAKKNNNALPSLHSGKFAPDAKPTILTGVIGMTENATKLLQKQ
ncbi:amidohydrolase [Colwellia sp. 4_MG-2023]|uniref:M20 metallopeptidase family protein n=1 Tax=unclassified Colwellia TaxID=196834 RepID=UPI0026E45D2E|nr:MULTISPECIES: amidohydrolase [unclassified Colwellia]MDO6505769.1 amidohydrolase [Colwellia sp. 5_MG-2023]MDO6554450.1 amidohydrolase [Colwellia sp. 4_MG-2023]